MTEFKAIGENRSESGRIRKKTKKSYYSKEYGRIRKNLRVWKTSKTYEIIRKNPRVTQENYRESERNLRNSKEFEKIQNILRRSAKIQKNSKESE